MDALCGTWQRSTRCAGFGSFAPQPTPAESFVVIERGDGGALRWSFGGSLGAVRLGYTTAPAPSATPAATPGVPADGADPRAPQPLAPLSVAFPGGTAWGAWRADGVLTLTLCAPGGALATQTYRVLDADTLAVSLTDVPAARGGEGATLQEGFLFRLGHQPIVA